VRLSYFRSHLPVRCDFVPNCGAHSIFRSFHRVCVILTNNGFPRVYRFPGGFLRVYRFSRFLEVSVYFDDFPGALSLFDVCALVCVLLF